MRRAPLLGVLLLALLAACERAAPEPEVPSPSLAGVEREVVDAITAAREALVREPRSGKAWGRLGDHYFVHDFLPAAAQCYARASELDPESYLWPYRLALSVMKDHPELAVAPLERCLSSMDTYAPAHRVYAQVLLQLARDDEAIEHFTRASELDPADPEAETGLGLIHVARGDFEAARGHLETALARDNKVPETHVALAQVYLALGMDKKAQRHAELSRTLPHSSRTHDTLASPNVPPAGARARTRFGRQLEQQGQPEQAAEQYRLALASNPDYYLARNRLAIILVAQGKRDEAIELLREYEHANPAFQAVRRDLENLLESGTAPEPEEEPDE